MKRTTCKHVVAALALLACLSLCAPATAHATVLPGPGGHVTILSAGLDWLAALWDGIKLVIAGGGKPGGAIAKDAAVPSGGSPSGGASMDDTSQINPDGHL